MNGPARAALVELCYHTSLHFRDLPKKIDTPTIITSLHISQLTAVRVLHPPEPCTEAGPLPMDCEQLEKRPPRVSAKKIAFIGCPRKIVYPCVALALHRMDISLGRPR